MSTFTITDDNLQDLANGRLTQAALAKTLGVSQAAVSLYLNKRHPDKVIGRGGAKTTDPTMLKAIEEALPLGTNVAKVAERYKLDYPALSRRVKRRRDKLAAAKEAQKFADMGMNPPPYTPHTALQPSQADTDLVERTLSDPVKYAKVANLIRALDL
jgi:predicted transcriptional regulator